MYSYDQRPLSSMLGIVSGTLVTRQFAQPLLSQQLLHEVTWIQNLNRLKLLQKSMNICLF